MLRPTINQAIRGIITALIGRPPTVPILIDERLAADQNKDDQKWEWVSFFKARFFSDRSLARAKLN